jgi:hypothetical protein
MARPSRRLNSPFSAGNPLWPARLDKRRTALQEAQTGRPARPQRVKGRGGTYQASLEPLASITCERIVTLPPVGLDRYVEDVNEARNEAGGLFQLPAAVR